MTLRTAAVQSELIRDGIIITGSPRSGTTLVGALISTLRGIEYHFEPPTMYMIASSNAHGDIDDRSAANLLRIYLTEDLLLESAAGRGVNLRPLDDSLVLNRMSWSDLHARWNTISNRADAIEAVRSEGRRIAVKFPLLFDALGILRQVMPDMSLVVSVRNAFPVVRSILRKGWVSDDGLASDLWPYSAGQSGTLVPYWVPGDLHDRWLTMNEETRSCLMWTVHAERGLQALSEWSGPPVIEVRYERVLGRPHEITAELCGALGTTVTPHSQRWLDSIRPERELDRGAIRDLTSRVDRDVLDRLERANSRWGY